MDASERGDSKRLRKELVDSLVQKGAISSPAVERAFRVVPRHLFVREAEVSTVYGDQPIFLRWEEGRPTSSSSQPTIMAIMAGSNHFESTSL